MLQLIGLLVVLDNEGVEILRASDLKLERTVLLLLDGNTSSVLSTGCNQKVLDFEYLLRLSKWWVKDVRSKKQRIALHRIIPYVSFSAGILDALAQNIRQRRPANRVTYHVEDEEFGNDGI